MIPFKLISRCDGKGKAGVLTLALAKRMASTSTSTSSTSRRVKIVEVGPRDGLQNEPSILPPQTKISLIQKLIKAGCTNIETASFVSPKWVPAMANAKDVVMGLHKWRCQQGSDTDTETETETDTTTNSESQSKTQSHLEDVVFSVLTPNERGMLDALSCGDGAVNEVAIFAAASETFSYKNLGCDIDTSMTRFANVVDLAKDHNIPIRGYVSCVLGCPYEGHINTSNVAKVSEQLAQLGCHEISLGDTIGVGTPHQTIRMLNEVQRAIDIEMIAVHFHDTYGQALANIYAALGEGVQTIDSAVGGIGGCPYAKGASGNVATEDVVYMLNGMDIDCGIDLHELIRASEYILNELGKESNSKCGKALAAKLKASSTSTSAVADGKICA